MPYAYDESILAYLQIFCQDIAERKGHKHLYRPFHALVDKIKSKRLDAEEERGVGQIVQCLCDEVAAYAAAPFHARWAARCFECADVFAQFVSECEKDYYGAKLKAAFMNIAEAGRLNALSQAQQCKYQAEAMADVAQDSQSQGQKACDSIKVCSDGYAQGQASESQPGVLALIRRYFEGCDAGRRPHLMPQEKMMHANFINGYRLACEYLERTGDYGVCESWFKILDPIHIGKILAQIPDDHEWDALADMIEETLDLQIEMLEDWKENAPESFRRNGGEEVLRKLDEF